MALSQKCHFFIFAISQMFGVHTVLSLLFQWGSVPIYAISVLKTCLIAPGTGHILQQSWAWTHSLVRLGCKAAALVLRKYHYHLQVIAQWNADPPLAIYLVAAF